ncbi:MAG: HlyD family efflux transporter periplasmic adaptor subunit [Bacillota bacterium]|nr:HlyD family efflux transporter periplasmic adaptor subunit [Bacillota bacterium]
MAKESRKKKIRISLLTLLIAGILVLWAVIYVRPVVEDALTQTEVVEYGTMQVTDDVTCYFIRSEEVFYASAGGTLQYYAEEGELIRKGGKILEILPAGVSYRAEGSGCLVSYYIDSYEGSFTPETMATLERSQVESMELSMRELTRESTTEGEALYKLVQNDRWYGVFWTDAENIVKYTVGSSVDVELPLGTITGSIYEILDAGDEWKVILEFDRHYQEMARLRKQELRVISADYDGLMVRNVSITSQEDRAGVFVKTISGEFVFTPVKIIASDGEYSLVAASYYYEQTEEGESVRVDTLEVYDEILTDAQS